MASYSSRSTATIVFAAVALCTTTVMAFVNSAFQAVCHAYFHVRDTVVDFFKGVAAKFERPVLRLAKQCVELVKACAYALRIAKRERPQVRDTWRMCPSI